MHPPASLHFVWRNKFVNMPRYANCFCFSRPSRFAHGLWSTVCISMRVSIGLHTIWVAAFEHLCYIIPKSCVRFGIEPLTNHHADLCILTPSITLIGWLLCVPRVVLCMTVSAKTRSEVLNQKTEIWNMKRFMDWILQKAVFCIMDYLDWPELRNKVSLHPLGTASIPFNESNPDTRVRSTSSWWLLQAKIQQIQKT